MESIPIEYIVEVSDALVEVDERAKAQLRSALANVDMSDVAAARAQIADIMERIVGASDIIASTMAASFYDGIREYQLGEKLGASTDSGRAPESTKNATYGITSRLAEADEPSISLVEGLLIQRVGYEIQRSVGRTMYRNGDRDPRKPKFARIPLGGDSCTFCRMLASRGFDYNSKLSAGGLDRDHYHDGCRCRVVCSWEKDPVIAGMDEQEYNLRAWDEYRSDAIAFAKADHSKHEQHRREKRRNRYTDDGKLKAGYSGLRIDKQSAYTESDRKKTAVRAAAQRGDRQARFAEYEAAAKKRSELHREMMNEKDTTRKAQLKEMLKDKDAELDELRSMMTNGEFLIETARSRGIEFIEPTKWGRVPSTDEITEALGGGDKTKGSCSSLAFAYFSNKAGNVVLDFRDGESRAFFATFTNILDITEFDGVKSVRAKDKNGFKAAEKVLDVTEEGKRYYFTVGAHAAVVEKRPDGFYYLELQTVNKNGWHKLTNSELKTRFGCKKSRTSYGLKLDQSALLIDGESLSNSSEFNELMGFINTHENDQRKGVGGYAK